MSDPVQTFLDKYPQAAWMFTDPELKWLVVAAMDPNTGFDSGRFTQSLQGTHWYQTHSDTQRQWLQFSIADPASAEQAVQQKMQQMRSISVDSGLNLSEDELRWEATAANQLGWDDMTARENLLQVALNKGQTRESTALGGTIGNAATQIRQLAAQYLLPISDQAVSWAAENIWQGKQTLDSVKAGFGQQAIHAWGDRNPGLAQAVQSGVTPRQFIDPQIQSVASTLEMSPDAIDPLNPKWSPILNYQDKTGALRMMTVPETQVWARSQDEFQRTVQGRTAASDMVQSLGKTFGQVK